MQTSATAAPTSYDLVPYPSAPFPKSYPNHLAAMARLFGVDAVAPSKARVLELGCSNGANLLPMADAFRSATFVGIDSSRVQIEAGQRLAQAAGLTNVELRHQDILDFKGDGSKFDYIVVHGVYSWVGSPVQARIIEICRDHLSENGIAYVSYNVLPGSDMRRSMREIARFHTGGLQQPAAKVKQARSVLKFLADSVPANDNAYGLLIRNELDLVSKVEDGFLYHDYLDGENSALYFHEFVSRAESNRLQYLCESTLSDMLSTNFPKEVSSTLDKLENIVAQEQYIDFIRNRGFRQTLLCRAAVKIHRNITPETVKSLAFNSQFTPMRQPADLTPGVVILFPTPSGQQISTGDAFMKAVLSILCENPLRALGFKDLLETARSRYRALVDRPAADLAKAEENALATNLLGLLSKGFLDIYAEPIAGGYEVPALPKVSEFTRLQARTANAVASRLNISVPVDALGRVVLGHCDGTRTVEQLVGLAVTEAQKGILQVRQGKRTVRDAKKLRDMLTPQVTTVLETLARGGMFVA